MFIVFGVFGIKIRYCELEWYCRMRKIRLEVKKLEVSVFVLFLWYIEV